MPQQPEFLPDDTTQTMHAIPSGFWQVLFIGQSWLDRAFVPFVLTVQMVLSVIWLLRGQWVFTLISLAAAVLLIGFAVARPLQRIVLRQPFTRSHAVYLTLLWVYSLLWLQFFPLLLAAPATGKESINFYIYLVLVSAITFRMLLAVYALTPHGYRLFFSELSLWEQMLVAINEFLAAGLLAFVLGNELARALQPDVFTLRVDWAYTIGLVFISSTYYLLTQIMSIRAWYRWLSRNEIWVRLARVMAPIALIVASLLIARHFTQLSDPRTATLLGGADLDQTILALSPILWMMIFYIMLIVYTGGRGLKRLLLPDDLLMELPPRLRDPLRDVSDMDILLVFGVLATIIPLQVFVFNAQQFISGLQQQLSGNALIDTTEQALSLIFALPFYVLAVGVLILYAYVMLNPRLSARDRDNLVQKLPITLIVIFIITLYLAAIPFSRVLTTGRIPDLGSELGYILAFNVLIPLVLFYAHYFFLIREPYRRGQKRWRDRRAVELRRSLQQVDSDLNSLQRRIDQCEVIWANRDNLQSTRADNISMLYDLIDLNGKRDRLNMSRLEYLREQQDLQEVTESPISLAIARIPARVIQYGIPLVLVFKIYEWAIVNDGLREVANDPNIGVLGFFQAILENTNF